MKTLEIQYRDDLPDVTNQSPHEFERNLRMALACKLFELGQLASGQAAELVGISRYEFLHSLAKYRVNAIDWDSSEFDQEVKNA